jgi:predicted alpha/beta-fold hydrolase
MPGKRVRSDFIPAPWLTNPHLQTLWPTIFRRPGTLQYLNERLELPDGDFVDLCWTPGRQGPLVVIIHGLEGSIRSPYATAMMETVHQCGWRGVFLHFRGCSGTPNRLDRAYHSGETGDIGFLIQTLVERYPGIPIAMVGYSLGGNAMLKFLGTMSAPVTAAVAVSVPYLLHDSADRLSKGLSRLYQRHLVASLKAKLRLKFKGRHTALPMDKLDTMHTFYEFDDAITAPMHGFAGVDDYYTQSSSRQYLGGIHTPTLLIHALDDPFMTPAALPQESELADNVILEVAEHGGHVGFIGGQYPWKPVYWLQQRIINYLKNYLV